MIDNCLNRYDCSFCKEYNDYRPEDKRIKSPKQIEQIIVYKEKRKELKKSEASKRGKRNKRSGYQSEKAMEKKYNKWGFPAKRRPLSGALKGSLAGDLVVEIFGKERIHEDKKRQNFNRYYELTNVNTYVMIENFCVMLSEEKFHALLVGVKLLDGITVPDKQFKQLHDFFEQDNADIVSCRQHGKGEAVYCITLSLWEELINGV